MNTTHNPFAKHFSRKLQRNPQNEKPVRGLLGLGMQVFAAVIELRLEPGENGRVHLADA